MDPLEKLQAKVTELVAKYEQIEAEKTLVEVECRELRNKISELERQIKSLEGDRFKVSKSIQSANEVALKRISKIVDKIDQFQSELKIS